MEGLKARAGGKEEKGRGRKASRLAIYYKTPSLHSGGGGNCRRCNRRPCSAAAAAQELGHAREDDGTGRVCCRLANNHDLKAHTVNYRNHGDTKRIKALPCCKTRGSIFQRVEQAGGKCRQELISSPHSSQNKTSVSSRCIPVASLQRSAPITTNSIQEPSVLATVQ